MGEVVSPENTSPPPLGSTLAIVILIQECAENGGFVDIEVESSSGGFYVVTLPPWDRTEDEVVCECPSYVHRGYCRHQAIALELVCNWAEDRSTVEQTLEDRRKRLCPVCGGPTRIVAINE